MPLFFLSIYFTKALRLTPCSKEPPGFSPSTKHKKPHLLVIRFILHDFEGSVDLLDKDQAHELMREGKL